MPHQTHIDYTLHHYALHLADNALVLGHRNSEWTGRGPILEQDIALSNIALDLIGQARYFYQHAARCINEKGAQPLNDREVRPLNDGRGAHRAEVTEDSLAYGRDGWDFRNCLLVELEGGDWAKTILRQFFFSVYQAYYYERLQHSRDTELSAIAEKARKEVIYHLRWSSEWVIRLGDGTAESHHRMEQALDQLWKFTGELFIPAGAAFVGREGWGGFSGGAIEFSADCWGMDANGREAGPAYGRPGLSPGGDAVFAKGLSRLRMVKRLI